MFPPPSSSSHWARGVPLQQQQQQQHGSAGSSRSSTPASHLQQQQQQLQQHQQMFGIGQPSQQQHLQQQPLDLSSSLPSFAFPPPASPYHPTSPLGFDVGSQPSNGFGLNNFMKSAPHQQQQPGSQGPSNLSLGGGLGPREPRSGSLPSYAFPPATGIAMPPPQSPLNQMHSPQSGGGFDFSQLGLPGGSIPETGGSNDTLAMAIRLGMSIGMSMGGAGGEMQSPVAGSPSFGGGSQGALSPSIEHAWNLSNLSGSSSPMNPPMLPRGRGLHHGRDPSGRTAPVPLPSSSSSSVNNGNTPSPALSSRSFDKTAGSGLYGGANKHSRQPSRTAESAAPSPSVSGSLAPSPSLTSTPGPHYNSPLAATGDNDDSANDHPTTKVWKLYAKQKSDPAGNYRMENLTWRMMAMSLKRDELAQLEAGLGPLSEDDERFLKELRESKNEETDQFDTGLMDSTQATLEQLLSPNLESLASLGSNHSHASKHSHTTISSDHQPKEDERRGRGRKPTARVVGFDAGFTGANE